MELLNQELQFDHARWLAQLGSYPSPAREELSVADVLRAHYAIADYFIGPEKGIGGIGPRDLNLLHSAVSRQSVAYERHEKWPRGIEKVATLAFGIVKDHPFHDANKRTALLTMLYHLQKIDRTPTAPQKELEDLIVAVADDGLGVFRRYVELKKHDPDAEVRFLADYLSRNSRKIDRRQKVITHQDLNGILRSFGYELGDPNNSFIDIYKVEERRSFIVFGKSEIVRRRKMQIHFPGWKRQVPADTVKRIRDEFGLTSRKGVDSQSFYGKADSLNALINEYAKLLERLADR